MTNNSLRAASAHCVPFGAHLRGVAQVFRCLVSCEAAIRVNCKNDPAGCPINDHIATKTKSPAIPSPLRRWLCCKSRRSRRMTVAQRFSAGNRANNMIESAKRTTERTAMNVVFSAVALRGLEYIHLRIPALKRWAILTQSASRTGKASFAAKRPAARISYWQITQGSVARLGLSSVRCSAALVRRR